MSEHNSQAQHPRFRFAPSPNGLLHLGHAYSALLNQKMANDAGGKLLLRIEDIDLTRCTPVLERAIYEDLSWLGVEWKMPVRRQSEHFDDYARALQQLIDLGFAYPATMTRGEIKTYVKAAEESGDIWPRDPDGAAIYPGSERDYSQSQRQSVLSGSQPFAWRLDMEKASKAVGENLTWIESDTGENRSVTANPMLWGDVVLSRSDAASSYHLSVVVDDALQGITHVVRGQDLYHATSIHRLLQTLLGLPAPTYHHHQLILDDVGKKLSKSIKSTGLRELRQEGATPLDIRRFVGL
jgi:glutamyl-Q tRNA(Asp) synthetase